MTPSSHQTKPADVGRTRDTHAHTRFTQLDVLDAVGVVVWILWLGAALVVAGSAAQITHRASAARALWLFAVLAFAAAAVGVVTAAELSLPLLLAVVIAIVATVALVAVTSEPKKPAVVRRGAK
jgi:hypothetical protein